MKHEVILFYKYVSIDNPKELADLLRGRAEWLHLKGRVIIAEEGINATLEGRREQISEFIRELLKDERFKNIQVKRSESKGASFPKLSVKVREEIVGTHFPKGVDPRVQTGKHIKPEELKSWFEKGEDFVIVDMRNNFEFISGHFEDSIDLGIDSSRDLPKVIGKLESLKKKKVLTVCTGGVRCEKMSAYLMHKGFENVHQLEGGIHSYMEKYPGEDFRGGLYTFDERLMMNFGGNREIVGECLLCNDKIESYVNCANLKCHLHFLVCDKCKTGKKTFCSEVCKLTNQKSVII